MHGIPDVKLLLEMELDALRTQLIYPAEVSQANVAAVDMFDAAQAVEHQEFMALAMSRLARRASEIRSALKRMREGDYGLCEGCGNNIPAPRLVAVPTATTCLPCQSELEQRQREYAQRPGARRRGSQARGGIEKGMTGRHLQVRGSDDSLQSTARGARCRLGRLQVLQLPSQDQPRPMHACFDGRHADAQRVGDVEV